MYDTWPFKIYLIVHNTLILIHLKINQISPDYILNK